VAWVSGDVLHLAELGATVLHDDALDFGEPVVLHALADNGSTTVALVSAAGLLIGVIHRHQDEPALVLIDSSNGFVPSAAHLRGRLRLAGACDGGTANCNGNSNRVLIYDARPDGGAW
jgi:hypothetical protein